MFCAVLRLPATVVHMFHVVGVGDYWTDAVLCRERSDMPHVTGQYCISERRGDVLL